VGTLLIDYRNEELKFSVVNYSYLSLTSVSAGSGTNPVTGVVYNAGSDTGNPLGALTQVTYGSGDFDQFTYDVNTGHMTSYQFNVGTQNQSYKGTVNWNANGTVKSLVTVDGITGGNAANNTTVNYAYDDLSRLSSASDSGGGMAQTYAYDAFGNNSISGAPFVAAGI